MTSPILPDKFRFYVYLVGFTAWVLVMGARAYFDALELPPPDVVVGAGGVVEWLIGAGLLTAATHTDRTSGRHTDRDGDGVADLA